MQIKQKERKKGGKRKARQSNLHPRVEPPPPSITLVSYFPGNVVAVDGFLLQKHVKTALVLGQRVTCNSADVQTEGKTRVWLLSAYVFGFSKMPAQMQIEHREKMQKGRGRMFTDLLMNSSRPFRRSSMKDSSKRPSSGRNGSCLFRALPGRAGTTIWERQRLTQVW